MRLTRYILLAVTCLTMVAACAHLKQDPDLCRGGEPFEQPQYHPQRSPQATPPAR